MKFTRATALMNKYCLGLCSIAALLSLGACAEVARTYPGPDLPREKIGIIRGGNMEATGPTVLVSIASVDGQRVHVQPMTYSYEVEPGERSFEVVSQIAGAPPLYILATGGPMREYSQLRFKVEPGHEYRVYARRNAAAPPTYLIWAEDLKTRAVVAGKRP